MGRIFNNKFWPLILIVIVTLISVHKVLGFYFWHDDFTWFYGLQTNSCLTVWPYGNLCYFLMPVYRLVGYTPFPYFLAGVVMFSITGVAVYFFFRQFYKKDIALWLSAIFSTAYIGASIFTEANGPFLVLPSFLLFVISLIIFLNALQLRINLKKIIFSICIFALSVFSLPARSSAYVFPFIFAFFLFSPKTATRLKVFWILIILLVYYLSFTFLSPANSKAELVHLFLNANLPLKLIYFSQTLGSFFLTDEIVGLFFSGVRGVTVDSVRFLMGTAFAACCAVALIAGRKGKAVLKVRLFSLLWVGFLYLPYGLRSDFMIWASYRYLFGLSIGLLVFWGTFSYWKYWKQVSFLFVFIYVLQSNLFLGGHLLTSEKRAEFYGNLHAALPSLPEKSIVYFEFPKAITNPANDYFRVGQNPSESSLGTEYQVDYRKIILATDEVGLKDALSATKNKGYTLYKFSYDGENINSIK